MRIGKTEFNSFINTINLALALDEGDENLYAIYKVCDRDISKSEAFELIQR